MHQPRRTAMLFLIAIALQGAHMIEHLAQLYQYAILWRPIVESHGILFFADLEWNHFTFNALYLFLLGSVFFVYRFYDRNSFVTVSQLPRYAFLAGFMIQGYHVLEHTGRIGQFLQTGCTPCPGFLGWYFNGIYLHFTLNVVTWLLPMIAFFAYGAHQALFQRQALKNHA